MIAKWLATLDWTGWKEHVPSQLDTVVRMLDPFAASNIGRSRSQPSYIRRRLADENPAAAFLRTTRNHHLPIARIRSGFRTSASVQCLQYFYCPLCFKYNTHNRGPWLDGQVKPIRILYRWKRFRAEDGTRCARPTSFWTSPFSRMRLTNWACRCATHPEASPPFHPPSKWPTLPRRWRMRSSTSISTLQYQRYMQLGLYN